MWDKNEFKTVVERYRDMVFRVAFNYMRSAADADDVCQDVFLSLYRSNKQFEGDEHLKAWLIRTTCNRCKSGFRSPWHRVANIDDYAASLEMPHEGRELLRCVLSLPERYRMPLYLYYYEGYRTAEIARILGIPAATVRTRLARGRARLKSVLGEGSTEYE